MAIDLDPDGEGVVHLDGTLDFATVPALYRETDRLLDAHEALTVDVSRVERVNSAGIALLLEWLAEARRRGCRLSFRGLPDSILAVARLSGVEELLSGRPLPVE